VSFGGIATYNSMVRSTSKIPKKDRFRGCLLGLAVGDAIGAPFEGLTAETIYRDFGPVGPLIANLDAEVISYTDDTQMAIGLTECLLQSNSIGADHLADCFCKNYEASRGYGAGMRKILDAMVEGRDWQTLVQSLFPGGSFGNGAAMRVAPVGLAFHHDLERLRDQAAQSARVTHLHPLAVDAAIIVAAAISILLHQDEFNSKAFFNQLAETATTEEFQWQLRTAGRLDPKEMLSFGSTLAAHRSVTTAITCFTVWPDSYEKAIGRAITMGEDTDTLAAIAGALSGAYLGVSAIPANWLSKLENGPKGRDYIDRIATELYAKSCESL
jgi:poly(ADP-ribose) glycohydrolase ARH3